jgi:hypothetical protein
MGEVNWALKIFVDLLSLAGEESVYALVCADQGCGND